MAGLLNKVKQVLHKDETPASTTHDTTTHGTTSDATTHGTSGNIVHGAHGTTNDPTHNSHLANQADPRIDSDRVGTTGGLGHQSTGVTGHSTTGGIGSHHGSDPNGPHDSRLANKADPRVDSDHSRVGGEHIKAQGVGNPNAVEGGIPHALVEDRSSFQTSRGTEPGSISDLAGGNHSSTGVLGSHDNTHHTHGSNSGLGGVGNTHGSNTGLGGIGSTHNSGLEHRHNDPNGPHSSHLANQADPRVDSDRVGTTGGLGHSHNSGLGGVGSTHNSGLEHRHNDPNGPHSSHLANQADPRVDSDRGLGNTHTHGTHDSTGLGSHGTHGTTGLGSHETHGTHGTHGTHTHGTHGSHEAFAGRELDGPHVTHTANALDPHVSSGHSHGSAFAGQPIGAGLMASQHGNNDLTGTHNSGLGSTHNSGLGSTHNSGLGSTHNTGLEHRHNDPNGPHSSHLANQADPRVDSDRVGSAGHYNAGGNNTGVGIGGTHTGQGIAGTQAGHDTTHHNKTTAGPHSDMLNKLDPRVDSDLDGGKTYGGNKTFQ